MDPFNTYDSEDQEADRVILNVGGLRFETYVTTLQNIADTRLAWLIENVEEDTLRNREFFFDRHPGAFVHILNFYRTGKLHTPTDMCGPAFEEELQFWGIDEKQMEPCCWEMFTKHREAELNLRTFEGPGFEDLQVMRTRKYSNFSTFEDDGCVKRNMKSMWALLNDPHSSELAKRFSLLSCGMIIISLSVYCLLTMPSLKNDTILQWINKVCLTFFTIEFILRVIVCPRKLQFVKDYKNWIDFLSIIPSYLMIAFPHNDWINNLVIIRLLRVFKFFKLSYGLQVLLHTLKASSYELTLLLLILLIPLVVFSSLVYAFEHSMTGGKTDFDSIPRTFWWAIVTMTTVGYGDLAPKTWPGQIIGSVCAIISVLIIALPISVIGNNFNLYYAHVRARLKLPKKNRHLLQGRLRGLLRQPAMLSSRDRDRKNITRRNGAGTGSLHGTAGIGLPNCGRLTIEHAQSPSPFLKLQRRGAAGLDSLSVDETSVEVSLLDNDEVEENKRLTNDKAQKHSDGEQPNSSNLLTVENRRDSSSNALVSQSVDEFCKEDLENEKIIEDFLSPKIINSPPMKETEVAERNQAKGRRRKNIIQEDVLNGFPTRSRRAAIGIPLQVSLEESLPSSGSSDSIILPSISLSHSNSHNNGASSTEDNEREKENEIEEGVAQPRQNKKLLSQKSEDNLILRRESMKKMSQYRDPVCETQNSTETPKTHRLRSNTVDNYAQPQMAPLCLDSNDEVNSLPSIIQKQTNNNNGIRPISRKSSNEREPHRKCSTGREPQKKTSLIFKRRPLKRSNTDSSFLGRTNKEGDNLPNHSMSIDDIMRTRTYENENDETSPFLRESGV